MGAYQLVEKQEDAGTGAGTGAASPWTPVVIYTAVLVPALVISWLVNAYLPHNPGPLRPSFPGDGFLGGWTLWDGGWYAEIARKGYSYVPGRQSSVAFFPVYPMLIRGVGAVVGDPYLGGIITTVVGGFASMALLWRWCGSRLSPMGSRMSVLVLALYPFSYYLYGAVYGETIFLVAAIGAFVLLEEGHPALAGVLGAVATGTRLVGVAVALALFIRALEQSGALRDRPGRWLPKFSPGAVTPAAAATLLSWAGVVGWLLYLWRRFSDPLLFLSVQDTWGQGSGPSTWFKVPLLRAIAHGGGTDVRYTVGCVFQGVIGLAMLAALPAVRRRFGLAYALYTLVVIGVSVIGTKDFQSVGRYALAAFPVVALVGEWLADRPELARRVLVVSAAFFVSQLVLHTKGAWVS